MNAKRCGVNGFRAGLLPGAVLATVSVVGLAAAEDFSLRRVTIDGGGAASTGSGFVLTGTIAQADAGSSTVDAFELRSGFWFPVDGADCDLDGIVGLFDFDDLQACVTGSGGSTPSPECTCADVDGDGDVDLVDFGRLQVVFNAQ